LTENESILDTNIIIPQEKEKISYSAKENCKRPHSAPPILTATEISRNAACRHASFSPIPEQRYDRTVTKWYDYINEPTLVYAIMDRLTANAVRMELKNHNFAKPKTTSSEVAHSKALQEIHLM